MGSRLLLLLLLWTAPSSSLLTYKVKKIDAFVQRTLTLKRLTLREVLVDATEKDGFSLSLAPGFFRYYAILGAVHAMDEVSLLKTFSLSGSSAGALIASFLATGMQPREVVEPILALERKDIWDLGGRRFLLGLLKGEKFHRLMEKNLPVHHIEECPVPFGCTVYDIIKKKTLCLTEGPIATAVRASCSFPFLFQPVRIGQRNRFCIDGAIQDKSGLAALPCYPPESKTIVNIMFGKDGFEQSMIPRKFKESDAKLITVVIEGIPNASPFSMKSMGPVAYAQARKTIYHYLQPSTSNQASLQKKSDRHHYTFLKAVDLDGDDHDVYNE